MIALSRDRHLRGFSLIEILVAFTIAAMALGVISRIFGRGVTTTLQGTEYAQAVAIAQSKLAEAGLPDGDNGPDSGREDDKYAWHREINSYGGFKGTSAPPLPLREVAVEVSWQSHGRKNQIQLHTLKPEPGK